MSEIAREELRLLDKQARYKKQGWTLNRDDTSALDAIGAFYAGTMDERSALARAKSVKAQAMGRWSSRRR